MKEGSADVFEQVFALLRPEAIIHDEAATGEGVRVCVIDSGIDRARLEEELRPVGGLAYPIEGVVFREEQPEPLPDQGRASSTHGTTVADIILRLAPRAQLYSADVFGPLGTCDVRVVIRAIRHAMNVWGCKLINLSLGIPEQRLAIVQKRMELLRTIEEAYYRDVLIIAAAHNDHPLTRSYPAAFAPPLLSVDKSPFTDPYQFAYRLREQVEFQACAKGYVGAFAAQAATSWAAPHLCGIAARILSRRPELKPFEMKAILYWLARGAQQEPCEQG